MRISKTFIAVIILTSINLATYVFYQKKPEVLITNEHNQAPRSQVFPTAPTVPPSLPEGTQVVRSLLGLEVKFSKGTVNYPGLMIVNDPRYQALGSHEKLVDALRFQPLQEPAFFLLVAIAKNTDGSPLIVPGKFNLTQSTTAGGLVLRDAQGRLFYYSGYLMGTPTWKNLIPGQTIEDKFCKTPNQNGMCSLQNIVKVMLKKPIDPNKDVPFLALIR